MVTLDGTSQTVTVTIAAQNDAATITGDAAGDVTEAGGVNNGSPGTPTDTGDLNSDDVDNPDDAWTPVLAGTAGDNGFGTFEMTATGVWSYTLDNNDPAVQALNGLDTLTDTLTVQTVDGTAQVITVTIHAHDDTPTVTGDITGNVVEAGGVNNGTPGTPTATGNVDSDDVDNPDDTWQPVAAGTATLGSFGTYAVTAARGLDLYPRQQRPGGAGAQRRRHAAGHLQRGDVGRHRAARHHHHQRHGRRGGGCR